MDIATLGIRIDGSQVVATTAQLNGLAAAGARAEVSTNGLSAAATRYAWAQKQGFSAAVLDTYRRAAEGAALSTGALAAGVGSMQTVLGRTVPLTQGLVAPVVAAGAASLTTEKAVSRLTFSMAAMARSGEIGGRSLRGFGLALMGLVPGFGWVMVAAMALMSGLNLLTRAAEKSAAAWRDHLNALRVTGPTQTAAEKVAQLRAEIAKLSYEMTRERPRPWWLTALARTGMLGGAARQGVQIEDATSAFLRGRLTDLRRTLTESELNVPLAEGRHKETTEKATAAYKAMAEVIEGKLAPAYGHVRDELKALNAEKERSIALDRAMLEAAGAYVDRVVAGLDQILRKHDPYRKTQDKAGADGGTLGRDLAGTLPTVGGFDLGALLSSPKSFGLGLLTSALDNIFNGAARAAAALRQFTLNMESFRAAMTGDTLAQSIAAVRQQAQALIEEAAAMVHGPAGARRLMVTVAEINRLEAVRIAQLEKEAAALAKQTSTDASYARQDVAVRGLRALGLDAEAEAMAFALEQHREWEKAVLAGASALDLAALAETQRQEAIRRTAEVAIAAAQKEADAAAQRLATAQSALDASKATLEGLRAYQATLRGLTGSPTTNLAASRAAFEAMATRARAGDQGAIAGIAGAGQTFLEQSRSYNASGAGYQRDVAAVSAVIDALASTYQETVDKQQMIVDLLTAQNRIAQAQLKALQDAEFMRQLTNAETYYAAAYTAAQAAGDFGAMTAALNGLRDWQKQADDRAFDEMLAQGTLTRAMLERLTWIADPSSRPRIYPELPVDPNTGEPFDGTVAAVNAGTAVSVAGFTQLSEDLAALTVEVGKLTVATRRTGEALAVA
jgi:hypothetical protein